MISLLLSILVAVPAQAEPGDAPGKPVVEKHCVTCHDLPTSVSLRQDSNGWAITLKKMVGFGMKASEQELHTMLDYLAEQYPAEDLPPVNINKARAIQIESRLSLRRSEAAVILQYRKEHGDFKSIEDLLKVPGIDSAKIAAIKDRLIFE